jgi:hypothetical protein
MGCHNDTKVTLAHIGTGSVGNLVILKLKISNLWYFSTLTMTLYSHENELPQKEMAEAMGNPDLGCTG